MRDFFELSYLDIMKSFIQAHAHVKGYKSSLAKAAHFQPSFLSQVLSETVQLTPDQAILIARFFRLDGRQTDYFITRVNYERAGGSELRIFLWNKLEELRLTSYSIDGDDKIMSRRFENAITLFSSWEFLAIYAALHLADIRSVASLAKFIDIPEPRTEHILIFLQKEGLIAYQNSWWIPLPNDHGNLLNRKLISRLFMNAMDSKAQTMALEEKKTTWKGGFMAMTKKEYSQLERRIVEVFHANQSESDDSDKALVAGVSFHLFKLE